MSKNKISIVQIGLAAASMFFSTSSIAGIEEFYLPCMYIGADAQIRNMKFQQGYGSNLYKSYYPQGNFYLGIKGNEYIGIEGGFEMSRSRTGSVFLPAGSALFGLPQRFPLRVNVIARYQGFHTSLIGFIPICNDKKFNLIIAAGVVNLKIQLENTLTQIANAPVTRSITLTQSKNIFRLMTGFQYMFNEYFGTRANIRWENTAQFKNIEAVGLSSKSVAKAKNSFVYGLGIFFQY